MVEYHYSVCDQLTLDLDLQLSINVNVHLGLDLGEDLGSQVNLNLDVGDSVDASLDDGVDLCLNLDINVGVDIALGDSDGLGDRDGLGGKTKTLEELTLCETTGGDVLDFLNGGLDSIQSRSSLSQGGDGREGDESRDELHFDWKEYCGRNGSEKR